MAIVSLFMVVAFSSCDEDEDNTEITDPNGNSDIYTPPANLSQEDIVEVLSEAFKNFYKEKKFRGIGITSQATDTIKFSYEYDFEAKKMLTVGYMDISSERIRSITYIEGGTEYFYMANNQLETKQKRKVPDTYISSILEETRTMSLTKIDSVLLSYTWKVEENDFKGVSATTTAIYRLTGNKKLAFSSTKIAIDNGIVLSSEYTYSYDNINPALPSGFKKEDFEAIAQYDVTVVWEDGSSNTFYSREIKDGKGDFYPSDVTNYTLVTSGKTLALYTDAARTIRYTATYITQNTTLYARWE
ncbi:MAG: hypothetical protein LBT48_01235 [Prevotellaceae bacterium]|jgi:hypothetical protein|nr:hypothetical protein [Prevotellaceae bacterium]